MFIQYTEETLNAQNPFRIILPYKHLYIENTSLLPISSFTVKGFGITVILKLKPNEFFDLMDVIDTADTFGEKLESVFVKRQNSFIDIIADTPNTTTFKVVNYGQ